MKITRKEFNTKKQELYKKYTTPSAKQIVEFSYDLHRYGSSDRWDLFFEMIEYLADNAEFMENKLNKGK